MKLDMEYPVYTWRLKQKEILLGLAYEKRRFFLGKFAIISYK